MNKKAKLFALIPIIFFSVSGGPFGLEDIVASVGPLTTLGLILLLPIIWTIPEVMIVAELSSCYPYQGGFYRWVHMGLGKFWGFMEGWWSILYSLIDLSLYPILFTTYMKILFPHMDNLMVYFVQLLVIWSCAFINILGIRSVGNLLLGFKFFILFSFLIFIYLGLMHASFDFHAVLSSKYDFTTKNIVYGVSLAFWNFIGWDNGSTVLEEVDKPDKNFHRALFVTIPIIVFFYFFAIFVGVSLNHNWSEWKFGEFSHISDAMGYPVLGILLAIGGMVMCLGIFNSLLLSSTRIFSTMAKDKFLPTCFAEIHNSFHTPYKSIIFCAFIYSVLVIFNFKDLVVYDVLLYLLAMFLEVLALVALRKKNNYTNGEFKIPFGRLGLYIVVGLASLIILLMILMNIIDFSHGGLSLLICIFLVFGGMPVYSILKSKNQC